MSDPTTTNETATSINSLIDGSVKAGEKAIDAAAEAALDTAVPFFALPVIHQISDATIELIVGLVAKQLSIGLQNIGTFIVIDTQVAVEKSGVSQALANLMIAEKSGDPHAIEVAIQAYADAQSALVHDDGSAPAHA